MRILPSTTYWSTYTSIFRCARQRRAPATLAAGRRTSILRCLRGRRRTISRSTYTPTHLHTYTSTHLYIYTHVHTRTHTHTHTHIHTHTYTHTHTHTNTTATSRAYLLTSQTRAVGGMRGARVSVRGSVERLPFRLRAGRPRDRTSCAGGRRPRCCGRAHRGNGSHRNCAHRVGPRVCTSESLEHHIQCRSNH